MSLISRCFASRAKDSFRKSMAWLHICCGLFCGSVLCAIFGIGDGAIT